MKLRSLTTFLGDHLRPSETAGRSPNTDGLVAY